MTFDELTQAIAGARERSERAKNYLSRTPSEQDRDDLLAVIDQLLPDARRYQWLRTRINWHEAEYRNLNAGFKYRSWEHMDLRDKRPDSEHIDEYLDSALSQETRDE